MSDAAPPPKVMMTADGRCPECRRKHGYIAVDLGSPSDNPYNEQMAYSHPACKTSACHVGALRDFKADEATPVLVLHRLLCDSCGKPIVSGSSYCEVLLPDGMANVHEGCMGRAVTS